LKMPSISRISIGENPLIATKQRDMFMGAAPIKI
jgi:hypothetical protein